MYSKGCFQADPEVGTFLTEIVADLFGVTWVAPPSKIPAREVKHAYRKDTNTGCSPRLRG